MVLYLKYKTHNMKKTEPHKRKEMADMKRLIALSLAAALSLSLAACGNSDSNANEEESAIDATSAIDVTSAIEVTPVDVYEDVQENEARALQNTYKVTGEIDTIESDCCQLDNLTVYLPTDTLANLNIGDTITFIGVIRDTRVEQKGVASRLYINFDDVQLIDE